MRGQSFAGHALADVATAGGSGAFLVGISPLFGFVAGGVVGAGAMEMIGVRRARGRDLATGIVLGASIGAGRPVPLPRARPRRHDRRQPADPVRLDLHHRPRPPSRSSPASASCASAIMAVIHRPLLLSSVSTDIAAARGVPVRARRRSLYMLALAARRRPSSLAIGAILSTALLIGPAATALRLTKRIGWASGRVVCDRGGRRPGSACSSPTTATTGAPATSGPVSFFIVAIIFLGYLATELPVRAGRHPSAPSRDLSGHR